jgi:Ca-activated chloride channel family protein
MAAGLEPASATEAGTNIGDALIWATRDALGANARRRVVVLVTDGFNEPGIFGSVAPAEAARLAGALGVVVHVVAIGPAGVEPSARPTEGAQAPPTELEVVAAEGKGRLFRAGEAAELSDVFEEIDRLEKSRVSGVERTRYREWYPELVAAALGLVVLEGAFRMGRFRRWP